MKLAKSMFIMIEFPYKEGGRTMTRITDIPTSRTANFIRFQRDPLGFLVDALPLGDVVSLRTSSFRPTYIINSPDFVQEILVHQEQGFRKGRSSDVLRRTIGDGLLLRRIRCTGIRRRRLCRYSIRKESWLTQRS